jgi:hypothetical protein
LAVRLRASGIKVLLCQKLVPLGAARVLWEQGGVLALRQLSNRHFGAVCALTGCAPLEDWRALVALSPAQAQAAVQQCSGVLKRVTFDGGRCTVIQGVDARAHEEDSAAAAAAAGGLASIRAPAPVSTVVCLPGAAQSETMQCEGAVRQAIDALRVLLGEPWVVPGAGAWEASVAAALRGAAACTVREAGGKQARDEARGMLLVAEALESVTRALGECDPICEGGPKAAGADGDRGWSCSADDGVRCGVCCCRAWGFAVAAANPESTSTIATIATSSLPGWVTKVMVSMQSGSILHFPRFDRLGGHGPTRACDGAATRPLPILSSAAAVLLRAESGVSLGTIARASLPSGSRVWLAKPRGTVEAEPWRAVLLQPVLGQHACMDGAASVRKALLRAIQAAELAARTDAEILPERAYQQAIRATRGGTPRPDMALMTRRFRLADKSGVDWPGDDR